MQSLQVKNYPFNHFSANGTSLYLYNFGINIISLLDNPLLSRRMRKFVSFGYVTYHAGFGL